MFDRLKIRLYGPGTAQMVKSMSLWHVLRITILSPLFRARSERQKTDTDRLRELATAISRRADYADTCGQSGRDADEMLVIMSRWGPM